MPTIEDLLNGPLADKVEAAESRIVGKTAEEVAFVIGSSILEARALFADKVDEATMKRLLTVVITPILQAWKDN